MHGRILQSRLRLKRGHRLGYAWNSWRVNSSHELRADERQYRWSSGGWGSEAFLLSLGHQVECYTHHQASHHRSPRRTRQCESSRQTGAMSATPGCSGLLRAPVQGGRRDFRKKPSVPGQARDRTMTAATIVVSVLRQSRVSRAAWSLSTRVGASGTYLPP